MPKSKDPKLARAGVSGYNKPKRTPGGSKKFVVVAKEGDKTNEVEEFHQAHQTFWWRKHNLHLLAESQGGVAWRVLRMHLLTFTSTHSSFPKKRYDP